MKNKTRVFGFNAESLETLNESLKSCNGGVLPSNSEIKLIAIKFDDGLILVHVELYNLPL